MPQKTVWIETYGCQMNKAESEALLLELVREGWAEGESPDAADLVVINTCSVRETAEERIRGRLGHYRSLKKGRPFTLALVGCMAERLRSGIAAEFPEVDVVAGTFRKRDLVAAVRESERERERVVLTGGEEYSFAKVHCAGGFKAFVPIMHGCDNFCTYCIVPYVRGREVSRDPDEILAEIRSLESKGVREITLLGQNVNSYHFQARPPAVGFARLLRIISRSVSGIHWVRFLTSHPRDLTQEIIEEIGENPLFCRHIHLPIQSGSSRILQAMNRGYTKEEYLRLVEGIRKALRGVSITTDILIGFPGETEEDFMQTLDLMERVGFDDAFMYYFNPREGTPAFDMERQLASEVKLERLARVIETQRRIVDRRMAERLGNEVEVLVEGISKKNDGELLARTEWDGMAVFPGPLSLIGSFARIRLEGQSGSTFRGRQI